MKNNEIHFSTQTEYTFEEYVRFSDRYCRFANFMSYLIWLGIGVLLIIFACYRQEYIHALMVLLVCISIVIRGEKTRKKKQTEEYNSPGSPKGSLFTFDFYSDCFQQTCDNLESEPIRYYDLLKIIETRTNFYLIYAKQEGCIIIKENCSPELIRFLHELRTEPDSPLYNEDKEAKISYEEITASIIEKIGCPCEILDSFQSTKKIMERYHQALANADKDGYPVLVPANSLYLEQLEIMEDEGYKREDLLQKDYSDGKQILDVLYSEGIPDEDEEETIMGELEDGAIVQGTEALEEFTEEAENIILFKIPVNEPWKIPIYVPIEFWNADLNLNQILSVLHYWYDTHQAIPTVIGPDTMQFMIEKEISSEQDAWNLAKEHLAFCNDRVYQCTDSGTLGELADSLMKSRSWYFWWD